MPTVLRLAVAKVVEVLPGPLTACPHPGHRAAFCGNSHTGQTGAESSAVNRECGIEPAKGVDVIRSALSLLVPPMPVGRYTPTDRRGLAGIWGAGNGKTMRTRTK
jgi:hypothetical protein